MTQEERLQAMNDAFAEAKVKVYELPPDDGMYECSISRMAVEKARWDDTMLVLETELKVASGQYEGHTFSITLALEDPDRMEMLKRHLRSLGFPGDDLRAIPGFCQTMLDKIVLVNVKTSERINEKTGEPYRNAYVSRVISQGDPTATGSASVSTAGDDDIPF